MSIVQRDYLMRMIEQTAAAIAEIVVLIRAGEFDLALVVVRKTSDLMLGNLRPVFERLDATSVVDLIGKHDLDRVRMYAALLVEEGTIRERRGEMPRAQYCFSRALDLYDAISQWTADWERIDMPVASGSPVPKFRAYQGWAPPDSSRRKRWPVRNRCAQGSRSKVTCCT